jgi:DNA-binding LacI/PurR family transcriptional regulator
MEIGRKAMELLLRKIKEPASEPEQILLPHQLVVRDSVKLLADQKPPQETR